MKRATTIFTLFILGISTTLATTNESKNTEENKSSVNIIRNGDQYKLIYPSKTKGRVMITLRDESNHILARSYVNNKKGFISRYDFTNADKGAYLFEITDSQGLEEKQITHEDTRRLILEKLSFGKVSLTVNNQQADDLTLLVYDANQHVLFENQIANTKKHTQVYDLKKINSPNLLFEVVDSNKSAFIGMK